MRVLLFIATAASVVLALHMAPQPLPARQNTDLPCTNSQFLSCYVSAEYMLISPLSCSQYTLSSPALKSCECIALSAEYSCVSSYCGTAVPDWSVFVSAVSVCSSGGTGGPASTSATTTISPGGGQTTFTSTSASATSSLPTGAGSTGEASATAALSTGAAQTGEASTSVSTTSGTTSPSISTTSATASTSVSTKSATTSSLVSTTRATTSPLVSTSATTSNLGSTTSATTSTLVSTTSATKNAAPSGAMYASSVGIVPLAIAGGLALAAYL